MKKISFLILDHKWKLLPWAIPTLLNKNLSILEVVQCCSFASQEQKIKSCFVIKENFAFPWPQHYFSLFIRFLLVTASNENSTSAKSKKKKRKESGEWNMHDGKLYLEQAIVVKLTKVGGMKLYRDKKCMLEAKVSISGARKSFLANCKSLLIVCRESLNETDHNASLRR